MIPEHQGDNLRSATAAVATAATQAIAGAAFGPGGALAAAGLAPVFAAFTRLDNAHHARTAYVLGDAAHQAGCRGDDLAVWIQSDTAHLNLVGYVRSAAESPVPESHLISLAAVLRDAITDDATMDMAPLYVSAIGQMQPAHVRVLAEFAQPRNPYAAPKHADATPHEYAPEHIATALPTLSDAIPNLLATLSSTGCIAQGASRLDAAAWWSLTPFGRGCLAYLQEAHIPT